MKGKETWAKSTSSIVSGLQKKRARRFFIKRNKGVRKWLGVGKRSGKRKRNGVKKKKSKLE